MKQLTPISVLILAFAAEGGGATLREVYAAGETLDYDLSWSSVSGGAARMTIAAIDANRLRITSVAKSGSFFSRFFKVRDEIESIVGSDDFSTLQYHKMLQEGSRRKDELTVVDERHHVAIRKGKSVAVPDPVFDPISLMYYVRTLDLTPGKTHEFTIVADGKIYKVTAVVGDRETIGTPAGTFKTIVVEPQMESSAGVFKDEQKRLLIWYTDDARHIPVRIRSDVKIGSITVSLRGMKAGVGEIEPTTRIGQ